MREIDFKYVIGWKLRGHFKELYHQLVSIAGRLDSSLMTEEEMCEYNNYEGDKWDKMYTKMVDTKDPENNPKVYIGSSLKLLLEENGYKDYNGPIRVYGIFGIRPTTKTHIAQIHKADILDEEDNIVKTIEKVV